MTFDSTINLSIIVALAAIFVPTITTIITFIHDSNLKKRELKHFNNQHIREIFEDFLSCYGEVAGLKTSDIPYEKLSKLRSATLKCLPYVSGDEYTLLFELYDSYYLEDPSSKIPRRKFQEFLPVVRKKLNDLRDIDSK